MTCVIAFTVVVAILTSSNYGNTCFTVLVGLICKDVGVLVIVACCMVRLPFTGADLGSTDYISFGVVTVDAASFLLAIVVLRTGQATSGARVNINVMPYACLIHVNRTGYLIICTVTSIAAYFLAARTTENFQITATCAVLGQVIVFGAESCVVGVIVLITIIAILTSGNYGNTCFAVLIGFVCKGVGVLVFVVRVVLRSPAGGSNFNVSDGVGIGVVTVGVATFSYIIVLICAIQATLGARIELLVVRNAGIIGVVRRGYVTSTATSVYTC
jgi:hypothetical protein